MLKSIYISFLINLCIFLECGLADTLQVCVDPYPPFKMVDSSGLVVGGIDIELTNALAEYMDFETKYTSSPWAGVLVI